MQNDAANLLNMQVFRLENSDHIIDSTLLFSQAVYLSGLEPSG